MPPLPPPPVPQGLRNMLKDYPGHIERLQDALDVYSLKPFKLMPFDGAMWALEGRLETFCLEADAEMEAAKASNDLDRVAQAKASSLHSAAHARTWACSPTCKTTSADGYCDERAQRVVSGATRTHLQGRRSSQASSFREDFAREPQSNHSRR
jgi:hypothetical protein